MKQVLNTGTQLCGHDYTEQVKNGWKEGNHDELLKPFYNRKSEITLHQGCLLWGIRVIVPAKLRYAVVLHAAFSVLADTHHNT
jgi:hypothetical protein